MRVDTKFDADIRAELQVFRMTDKVEERRNKWYDHVWGMSSERAPLPYHTIPHLYHRPQRPGMAKRF